jgi:hypothetical protein
MRKSTLALVSFIAGVLCTTVLGNQASTRLQPGVFAQFKIPGAVPVVPPLRGTVMSDSFVDGTTVFLDGVSDKNSTFNNATFEYGGGAYNLENATIVGAVGIHLVGAANNTATFLKAFGLIGCPAAPPKIPKPNPNAPMITTTTLEVALRGDLVSPYGQK